jgi:hypothetical protein
MTKFVVKGQKFVVKGQKFDLLGQKFPFMVKHLQANFHIFFHI